MKTTYLSLIILVLAFLQLDSKAQNKDSLHIVNHRWEESTLREGVTWKKGHFKGLFNSNQIINIIEIELNKKNLQKLGLEGLPNSRRKTSTLADSLHALVAINGGFFDMKNGGAVDYIKVNNKVINYTRTKSARANAYLAFDEHNLRISPDSIAVIPFKNVLLAGPYLLEDGKNIQLGKDAFNNNRHPRTAVALKNHKLILLTADGRNANAEGLSLHELADIFRWYGCSTAMNLDGGGSTAMYIKDQPAHGIVNYPSDNKQFDHLGERTVSNIIYLK
ncbi:phosphodiester glycosidase family protein [Sphingobacterium rhinopitheci]|uniref:phosphodiester glycosidase family protein n=1 Tax=Sphingobacterium rhinopitheci TaxID=2781960 RepID=UPI001F51582E|nr:phosphodiester glycosidase family protein [Sphingobacterium rhinopitheci]MCI0920363.1 phosphodiester glycosidase family protein [Sphingobacterium rhinopitheci]